VTKNSNSGRRYKQLVRAMKRLENDMVQTGRLAKEVHGYFIECLLYNIPNPTFTDPSYKTTAKSILSAFGTASRTVSPKTGSRSTPSSGFGAAARPGRPRRQATSPTRPGTT
jgi:hypothetical protein